MPIEASVKLQRVLVLVSNQPDNSGLALPDLGQNFPQADLTIIDLAQTTWPINIHRNMSIDWIKALDWLRQGQFDAAVIMAAADQSPYTLGYLCCLAGIPICIGQSNEFGGQGLSYNSPPPDIDDCHRLLALFREMSTQPGNHSLVHMSE